MSNERVKEVLAGQAVPVEPTLAIMRGAVARLDMMMETIRVLEPFLVPAPGMDDGNVGATLLEWASNTEEYLTELAVARLFRVMVLKLQRPLSPVLGEELYLVYNKDRSLMEQMLMSPEIASFFPEGEYKVFVKARLWNDGTLQLIAPAPWQDW